MRRLVLAAAACFTILTACGFPGPPTLVPSLPAGQQSYTPTNSSTGVGGGSGSGTTQSPALTSVTCSGASSCAYWYCRCADSAVVNAAFCSNGYCAAASGICGDACTTFSHGAWTGEYSGGPSSNNNTGGSGGNNNTGGSTGNTSGCSSASQCPSYACVCGDGSVVNSRSCTNGQCDSEAGTCPGACSDNGGWP